MINNSVTVSPAIAAELRNRVLPPLYRKTGVVLPHCNLDNIDGLAIKKKSTARAGGLQMAYPDMEGAGAGPGVPFSLDDVDAIPVPYVLPVNVTMLAARKFLPGATYEQVVAAIESNSEESIPLLAYIVEASLDAHLRAAESVSLSIASTIAGPSGTSGALLTTATLIDCDTKLLAGTVTPGVVDGKPSHEDRVVIVDDIAVGHLRKELATGSGASLSAIFGNPSVDAAFFQLNPDVSRNGFRGVHPCGLPIYAADSSLQAQDGTDRFGMIMLRGVGALGAPGAQRGFIEFCEGHAPNISFDRDIHSDVISGVSRWEWIPYKHTVAHAGGLLYKKTLT